MKDPRVYSVWSSKQQEGLYFVILRKYYFSSTYIIKIFGLSTTWRIAPAVFTLSLYTEAECVTKKKKRIINNFLLLFWGILVPGHNQRLTNWEHSSNFRATSLISSF